MFLMAEKGIRGGKCDVIHRYAKANNNYMKNYDKNIESSYLMYLDANNLYGWAMSQKLPINSSKWVEDLSQFNEDFIKNYDGNSDKGYIIEANIEYPKKLFNHHKDYPVLAGRKKIGKCEKLICDMQGKENYVDHIRVTKQALNRGLILQRAHRVIQLNQEAWMKLYIDMNTKLRKEAKNEFDKDFFKLMNNAFFGKTMEDVRNYRHIKLVTTDKRRNQLVSEPNYHTSKYFSEHLMAIEIKKTKVKMNKPIHLGMLILGISKTLMRDFWYDYIKSNYVIRIPTAFLFLLKLQIFTRTLLTMLRNGLTHLPMMKMMKDLIQ